MPASESCAHPRAIKPLKLPCPCTHSPACQVVLEVLERNVKRGSLCYERGHTAVLAWCESSRDVAQLTRILTQLCAANRADGGGVVVVLTQQVGWGGCGS